MIVIVGVFAILLGILFDDVTTLILFTKGMSVLETNPIFLRYGFWFWIISSIIFYSFIILAWIWMVHSYKNMYKLKGKGFKITDIFVFIFCVFIIFFASSKIYLGYNNMQLMGKYMNQEERPAIIEAVEYNKMVSESNPVEFKQEMERSYWEAVMDNISYTQMWVMLILGFLLFRVGVKVCPYEYG